MARQDEEQQRRPQEDSALGTALKVGGIVGAGALGWRYRRQIGSGLRNVGGFAGAITSSGVSRIARMEKFKNTAQDIGTFARAMHHATDSRGVLSHMRNPGRFEDRFNTSLQYSLEARARAARSDFGGEPLEALQSYQNTRIALKGVQRKVFEDHRFQNIERDIKENMPNFAEQGLISMLALRGESWLYNMSKGKVEGFTEHLLSEKGKKELAHSIDLNDDQKKKFVDNLFGTLSKYQDMRSEGTNLGEINRVSKDIRHKVREGYVNSHKQEDTFMTKLMAQNDFHQMTIEDAIMHKKGNLLAAEHDAIKIPRKDGSLIEGRLGSKLSKMAQVDPRYNDLVADRNVWINSTGDIMDMRWARNGAMGLMEGFQQNVQIPFLRFNPLDLMHFTTFQGVKDAPKVSFRGIGTIDPALHGSVKELRHPFAHNQDARVGMLGGGYVNTADGNVYSLTTGDLVKQDVFQASARFGMVPRAMAGIANLHTQDYRTRTGKLGKLAEIFDIGKQETESIQARMLSTITKFDNPEWGRNLHNAFESGALDAESTYKIMYSQFEAKSKAYSDDVVNYINPTVKKAYGGIDIDLTRLNTDEEVMSALGRLSNAVVTPNSGVARASQGRELEGLDKLIYDTWQSYEMNPTAFMRNKRIRPNNAPYTPEFLNAMDLSETDLIEKADDVRRLIHMHAARQLEYGTVADAGGKLTVGKMVQQGISEGELAKDSIQEVRNLEGLTVMRQWWEDVYNEPLHKDAALEEFGKRILDGEDALSAVTQGAMKDMSPMWAMGPGEEPPQYFGLVNNISMNKGKGYKWALENYNKQTAEGVSPVDALLQSVGAVAAQPFRGRANPGEVTSATLPFYYLSERLDNAIAQTGLGLSQKNRGSAQSILFNQFGRRIVLPYMAYQQAVWADGMFGDMFSDKAAESYVNMHEDLSWIKELTGVNDIGRQWSRVFSGADQLNETPIAKAFNFATLGLFTDFRSGEEVGDYYESGEDAIRKGRYWGIGSSTPYTGGKIDRYVPNWYRRAKSDWAFTDTLYGSEAEYFRNHWMPTLTNPFAPLNHFLLDTNHWEEKHMEDRPYPITGGFSSLQQIPLAGPLINNTVGRILKPRITHPELEKAHREYIAEINANIEAQYKMAGEGGFLQGMPAGGTNIMQGGGGAGGTVINGGGDPQDATEVNLYGAAIGSGAGAGGGSGAARQQLAAFNAYYTEMGGPSLGSTGKNVRSVTALEDLRDPDVLQDLQDISTMYTPSGTLRDTFYSMSEVAGMYGFLTKSGIGFQESGRGMVLDESSRMTSYARSFWDMELGGLGGQLSEIGRRYVPRDPNKNYWNPIKNKMPDWMPGSEYFIDFKHGDPYTKVANGEMRLPGESYETLYDLHPDALGEYGAFDRFRILADVAPYSENYKFYKKMVSQMNASGALSEDLQKEYGEIRDQVSSRRDKHRFYKRRFTYSDVDYETVTITKMLDATTFLTKEHPNSPIKMAGVKVKSDDMETQEWLQQYVHEGAKVRIAVDDDPLFRVRDDTFNTMRAVVYAGNGAEGEPFYMSTKGQNVNFMLANRKSGGFMGLGGEYKASVHDDGSATATQALFSKDMVTVGKMWEWMTHDVLPTLPVIGTIADKFLQIRSPLELYKRQEVYGKAWRPWTDPWGGWIQPMLETMGSRHPVIAAAQGAGIGWLFAKKGPSKFWGSRIGAIIGGGVATARVFLEQTDKFRNNGELRLPKRRREEREINEYFDKIKYIKYKGLYERARREAMRREGVDIQALLQEHEDRGGENKKRRNHLQSVKKWLSMNKKLGNGDKEAVESQLDEVRATMKEIEADRPAQKLGKYSMLALRYKSEYESTLHGADENGDMTKIFRALPNKDREFFTEFMKAAPEEREEILRLVPKDQRRFYQAKWGLEVDKKENLGKYFSKHYLPGANWEGWRPDTSLENYKLKVVKNEGLELTEFGYWGDDEKRAEISNANVMDINSVSSLVDVTRLERVLRGAGLSDVSVSMNTTQARGENKINLAMDVMKDRSQEITSEINNNLGSIFST